MKIPQKPPRLGDLLRGVGPDRLLEILETARPAASDGYPPWDKFRHLPTPPSLSLNEWWLGVKLSRLTALRPIPFLDTTGSPFKFGVPDPALAMLRRIDRDASGRIAIGEEVTNQATRDRYIISSLIEEAITSSQLEGASTTRRVAKDMLRTGRPPRDKSERMILNNYLAMRKIGGISSESLTPELVLDIHRVVTDGTLGNPQAAGRLQLPTEERVQVFDERDLLLHAPPPAEELPGRLRQMCDFANEEEGDVFIHPVMRAVILHFWLAYDHPFEDGNGRTARALFYWSMLHQGYWLAEFISISRILKKAPAQYARAFLYTETDDNDLTYFVLYQLDVIIRAIDDLHGYLARKIDEIKTVERLIRQVGEGLNHRQVALLSHALRNPDARYTMQSHARSHNVVYETARSDLTALAAKGLLSQRKAGKAFVFHPVPDLAVRLRVS
ncbi:MAG: Fic family protein [Actinomycetota bacterium]